MGRHCFPFLILLVSLLCTACGIGEIPAGTAPPATATDRYRTAAAVEVDETAGVGAAKETEVTEDGQQAAVGTPEPGRTTPPAPTEPGVTPQPGQADVLFYGWVAGDYLQDGQIAGVWVRVEEEEQGEPNYPGLPHYDCWGGCYVPVVAATCPVPEIGTLEMVRVSGRNLEDGFGIDVCFPGGSMAPTGRTAEGDPADLVHFLAIYQGKDLYNRESTILATVVEVLSGSPDDFSEVVRIRDGESSFWEPAGRSFEEGMALEVFGWFEDPVAPGRPFAVFSAAFLIWDQ
jgi:hypothetical protein